MRIGMCDRLAVVGMVLGACALAFAQEGTGANRPPPTVTRAGEPTTAQPADGRSPRLELSATEFDFGEVWQGMAAKQVFTVKNVGTAPLTLKVRSDCGCAVATKPKTPLEPGESSTFSIAYNTQTYTGPAKRKVTLTTNDPIRQTAFIPVRGNVKPLFAASPSKRISLQGLDRDSVETRTVKLENKYDSPVHLKLGEGQDFGAFDVKLKEIKPGTEYELTVTTKPPLRYGFNRAKITLKTGLEKMPTYVVHASANAQPPVLVLPPKLYVTVRRREPAQQRLRVQYRTSRPLKIVEVRAEPDSVKYEMMPSKPPESGRRTAYHELRVTLPVYDGFPEDGGKLVILTDDEGEFREIEVPILKRASLARKAVGVRPPQSPTPIKLKPVEKPKDQKPEENADGDT